MKSEVIPKIEINSKKIDKSTVIDLAVSVQFNQTKNNNNNNNNNDNDKE